MKKSILVLLIYAVICIPPSCDDGGAPDPADTVKVDTNICDPLPDETVSPEIIRDPIWHPSGKFIGFNYTKVDSIVKKADSCIYGQYYFNPDSSGFWLIDTNGSNMRLILKSYITMPAWSPDGQWLAFSNGNICKIKFTGEGFDLSTFQQLNAQGISFFPSWSPDGQWIVYSRAFSDTNGAGGVWIIKSDGSIKKRLFGGVYPSFSSGGTKIVSSQSNGIMIYSIADSIIQDTISLSSPSHPRFSLDDTKIYFWTDRYEDALIWSINVNGSGLSPLFGAEGSSDYTISPNQNLFAITHRRYNRWNYDNDMIWIYDKNSGSSRQLTFIRR